MQMVSPRAGKPVDPSDLVNLPRLVTAYFTTQAGSGESGAARRVRHLRPSRLRLRQQLQRGPHPRHHPGDLPVPQGAGIDGPLFIGIDTHALSEPALASALEVLAANGVETMIDQRRRLHADAGRLARHPDLQPRPRRAGWPTASSSPPRTTRRRMAASSTTRRMAGRPTPTSPAGSRAPPTSCSASGLTGVQRMPLTTRAEGRRPRIATTIIDAAMSAIWQRHRHGGDPRRPASRSASIRWAAPRVALLGAADRPLRHRRDRGQRHGRPDLPLHDRGLGRQDPHGLLVALRHGRG